MSVSAIAGWGSCFHIDGRLDGAIEMIRDSGADCGDAITPIPLGDLTAQQCRDAAGRHFIISGGVSPDLWFPNVDTDTFKNTIMEWLELKKQSPRLIANAGDWYPQGRSRREYILCAIW